MVPCRGPMVCSASRPSSSRYSHSTPIAMKDLELGSTSFSSFKMNMPVSRFLTAGDGRRWPPGTITWGQGPGAWGRRWLGPQVWSGQGSRGEQSPQCLPAPLPQGLVCTSVRASDHPNHHVSSPHPLQVIYPPPAPFTPNLSPFAQPRGLSWICPHRPQRFRGFLPQLSGPPPCGLRGALRQPLPPCPVLGSWAQGWGEGFLPWSEHRSG